MTNRNAWARSRRLHLGAFMRPISIHTGTWRYRARGPVLERAL